MGSGFINVSLSHRVLAPARLRTGRGQQPIFLSAGKTLIRKVADRTDGLDRKIRVLPGVTATPWCSYPITYILFPENIGKSCPTCPLLSARFPNPANRATYIADSKTCIPVRCCPLLSNTPTRPPVPAIGVTSAGPVSTPPVAAGSAPYPYCDPRLA